METTSKSTKWLTIILLAVVLVLIFLLIGAKRDLNNVLAGLDEESRDYQKEIEEECADSTVGNVSEECKEVLEEFGDLLGEYNKLLEEAEVEAEA
ncbi:MAG: hypothetical protein Q8Q32_00740 [bacterium]|nr:hypothetical protein [bacterium]